jgi:hypothetical protein
MKPITILDKIKEFRDDPNAQTLTDLKPLAMQIILDSIGKPQWEEIIKHFADEKNPENVRAAQLARLRLEDDLSQSDEGTYLKQTVAYLMANITCGGSTGTKLHINIDEKLDDGIDYGAAPSPTDIMKQEGKGYSSTEEESTEDEDKKDEDKRDE